MLVPNTLKSYEFQDPIEDQNFHACWGGLTMDEAHMIYKWGVGFQFVYGKIWTYALDHIGFVALSASVEPGHKTKEVIHHVGFCQNNVHFDRHHCKCPNVDYVFYEHTLPN
jgi:superfamily II DNA helicase RecQ